MAQQTGGFAGLGRYVAKGCSVSPRFPALLEVSLHCWKRRPPVLGARLQAADQRSPSRLRAPWGPPFSGRVWSWCSPPPSTGNKHALPSPVLPSLAGAGWCLSPVPLSEEPFIRTW